MSLFVDFNKLYYVKGIKPSSLVGTRDKSGIKTVQYADDIIILVKNEKSLQIAIKTIDQFSDSAGPTLNVNKSEIIATGKYRNCHEICGIRVESNVRCLEINVGHDKSVCNANNWTEKVDKFERTLSQWKNRHLTFFGKITV